MDHVHLFMIYRILIVLGGILCIYLGYRLFFVVQTKQGELSIKTGEHQELNLRDVAPGVFFALFGASILTFCLLNGITIKPIDNGVGVSNMPRGLWQPNQGLCMSQRVGEC